MTRKVNQGVFSTICVVLLGLAGTGLSAALNCAAHTVAPPNESMAEEDTSGLDELSAADRAAAKKQKICPVMDTLLGSMGTPVKVTVKGRDVFLCCAGCKAKLLKNPDKYLEKLDKPCKK